MPLLPHISVELPDPGESPDGSETTKITKQHNYDKLTDICARWYTANANAKQPCVGESSDGEKKPNLNLVHHEYPVRLVYTYKFWHAVKQLHAVECTH